MTQTLPSLESLQALEDQLMQELDAVRRLKDRLNQGRSPILSAMDGDTMHSQPTSERIQASQARPSVEALTRQAVTELEGSFGIGEVKARVRMHFPRGFGDVAIRTQLKRLEQEGELVLTSQGFGRAGNQYAKTSRFQPNPLT